LFLGPIILISDLAPHSSSTFNTYGNKNHPTPPTTPPIPSSSSSVTQLITATTLLTSTVECIVSIHNERILGELIDAETLDKYQNICENVWDGASKLLHSVKSIRDVALGFTDDLDIKVFLISLSFSFFLSHHCPCFFLFGLGTLNFII